MLFGQYVVETQRLVLLFDAKVLVELFDKLRF